MSQVLRGAAALVLGTLLWSATTHARNATDEAAIEGTWEGALDTGAEVLRVFFTFSRDAAGNLVGVVDSPDQTTESVPIDAVTFDGKTVRCDIRLLQGTYQGSLIDDPRSIRGTWTQGGTILPLDLVPSMLVRPARPQEPEPPFPYDTEEVSYVNAEAGVRFAGTLTKPRRWGRHPAVLLITGSGAQNRDEEVYAHKPFFVLADALTRRGLAVLRVDDRGVGGTTGDPDTATTEDFIGDALAGLSYLQSRRDIDARRVGLLGHSEGGMIAPAVAARSADVAFIVMLAGTGVSGDQLLLRQVEQLTRASGEPEEPATFRLELFRQLVEIAVREPDDQRAMQEMTALWQQRKMDAASSQLSAETKAQIASAEADADVAANMAQLLTPWMRYFITYDPAPALSQVQCPVLALNGDLDLQVDSKQNLPAIATALAAGPNRDHTLTELPGLNHLFQPATTGLPQEYGMIELTIDPGVLELVGDWITARVR